jgi:hypothetical protein
MSSRFGTVGTQPNCSFVLETFSSFFPFLFHPFERPSQVSANSPSLPSVESLQELQGIDVSGWLANPRVFLAPMPIYFSQSAALYIFCLSPLRPSPQITAMQKRRQVAWLLAAPSSDPSSQKLGSVLLHTFSAFSGAICLFAHAPLVSVETATWLDLSCR